MIARLFLILSLFLAMSPCYARVTADHTRAINSAIASSSNNTTTALGASETYTGTAELSFMPDVMVTAKSDVAGTLYFEFSDTGDFSGEQSIFPVNGFVLAANTYEFHTAVKGPRYFRVRYVNGGTAQSSLRINTYFGEFDQGNLPINATISADADARVIRSVDSQLDLAFGRFAGMFEDTKFGSVEGIDALDNAFDVWAFGSDDESPRSDTKTFPSVPATLYMSSASASDTNLTLEVQYIDSNGARQILEDFNYTGGQSGQSLGISGLDILRVTNTGSVAAQGDLYFTNTNDFAAGGTPNTVADVLAFVKLGDGQTQQTHYTVGEDEKVRIKHINIHTSRASGAAGTANVFLYTQDSGAVPVVKRKYFTPTTAPADVPIVGIILEEGARYWLRVDDVSDNDTNVTASIQFDEVEI